MLLGETSSVALSTRSGWIVGKRESKERGIGKAGAAMGEAGEEEERRGKMTIRARYTELVGD